MRIESFRREVKNATRRAKVYGKKPPLFKLESDFQAQLRKDYRAINGKLRRLLKEIPWQ